MGASHEGNQALRKLLVVKPGSKVDLARFDCAATLGRDKHDAAPATDANLARLTDLQERLYAEAKHAVLIVLQGIDAAGKDGTISVIAGAFNPQGTPVTSFKVPPHKGSCPRLPVASPRRRPRQGRDRHLQPQPLRVGAHRPRPQPRA